MEKQRVIEILKKHDYNTSVCFEGRDRYYKKVETYAKDVYVEFTNDILLLCVENHSVKPTQVSSGIFDYKNDTEDNLLWLLDKFDRY